MHKNPLSKLALVLWVLALAPVYQAHAQSWKTISFDPKASLTDMHFINDKIGFLSSESSGPSVWKTIDSGLTWTKLSIDSTDDFVSGLYAVDFVTEDVGFVAGESNTFAKTTDGGKSWKTFNTKLPFGVYSRVQDIYFHDTAQGIAITQSGHIINTQDGGASWKVSLAPKWQASTEWSKIDFHNDSIGFVSGFKTSDTFKSVVLRTSNGGKSWDTSFYQENSFLVGFSLNKGNLTAIVREKVSGDNFVLFSNDLGKRWELRKESALSGYIAAITMTSGGNILALSADSGIVCSQDSFRTWKYNPLAQQRDLTRIFPINDTSFFLFGYQGALVKYTTGKTVVTHARELPQEANSMVYPNPSKGMVYAQQFVEQVQVFNMAGTEVLNIRPRAHRIDLSVLEQGVYVLVLQTDQGTSTHRFVKY